MFDFSVGEIRKRNCSLLTHNHGFKEFLSFKLKHLLFDVNAPLLEGFIVSKLHDKFFDFVFSDLGACDLVLLKLSHLVSISGEVIWE